MAATTLSTAIQVNDAIASVVVTAFAQEKNLADLIDLNSSASHVLELAISVLGALSPAERRVLVFSLNLVKDIAMAKAVTIAGASNNN